MIAQKELTFRFYNIVTQAYDRNMYPSAEVDQDGHFTFMPEPNQFLLEQYSGQKDKTNKKIFENDVLESEQGGHYRVAQIDGKYVFLGKEGKYHFDLLKDRVREMRVVGTIHDEQYKDFVISE